MSEHPSWRGGSLWVRLAHPQTMRTVVSISVNIAASVGLILVNKKLVITDAQFHYGTALTMIHFMFTFWCCAVLSLFNFFDAKWLDLKPVAMMSAVFSAYLWSQNLSLVYNTVTFYQIAKIGNTPAILGMEYLLYNKSQNPRSLLTLGVVCFGIYICVMGDTTITMMGTLFAILAIVFNSLYTIWGKYKQEELKCNPPQLLLFQAPTAAAFLTFPLTFDNWDGLLVYDWTPQRVLAVGVSCLLAATVNLSFFWMVGRTDPVTANVVGYVKTAFVFIGGFILFREELTAKNIMGILITLSGSIAFTYCSLTERSRREREAEEQTDQEDS